MNLTEETTKRLAQAFLAGPLTAVSMVERTTPRLKKPWPELTELAEDLVRQFGQGSRPHAKAVVAYLLAHPLIARWVRRTKECPLLAHSWPVQMQPAEGPPLHWQVPPLLGVNDLANLLSLSLEELQWFAERTRPENQGPLAHYQYRWIPKRSGGHRLLEIPKQALKQWQRRVHDRITRQIPCHPAVHSFQPGKSILTYVSAHCAQAAVLRLDLADFFPSLQANRVSALLRTAGYPDAVASLLAGLCCHTTPERMLRSAPTAIPWWARQRLAQSHLPQGAPSSPWLSNVLLFRLDRRLAGLASALGIQYSRYADDLAFSGDAIFARRAATLVPRIGAIVLEEGFVLHMRKTRLMRANQRQRLGGLIINERPNISRHSFDRFRAILFNASRLGPLSQVPETQMVSEIRQRWLGQIAWVSMVHPVRGEKLQRLFDQINWAEN